MDRLYELCLRERHEEIDALLASSAFEKRGLAGLIGSEKNFQESLNGFRGASNRTVLHCAVSGMTIHTGLVKAFIQHGADVNAVDVYGETPLFYVCKRRNQSGTRQTVRLLLKNGADPAHKNRKGETVMTVVALNPYLPFDVVGLLLGHGAITKDVRHNGKLVTDLIIQNWRRRNVQERYMTMLNEHHSLEAFCAASKSSRECACKMLPTDVIFALRTMLY